MASRTLLALCGLLAAATTACAYVGEGTAYSGDYEKDAMGRNACGFGDLGDYFEKYYAARPTRGWNPDSCGQCIRARGLQHGATGKWVKVMIVDQCQGCKGGDVDFSTRALKEITGFSWDRKLVEWEYISCDADANSASSSTLSEKTLSADSVVAADAPAASEEVLSTYAATSEEVTTSSSSSSSEEVVAASDGSKKKRSKKAKKHHKRRSGSSSGRRLLAEA